MKVINTKDLHENTAEHILALARDKEILVITHHGKFIAIAFPLDDKKFVEVAIQEALEQGLLDSPGTQAISLEDIEKEILP